MHVTMRVLTDFTCVGNVELIDWELCNMCPEIMDVVPLVCRHHILMGKFIISLAAE